MPPARRSRARQLQAASRSSSRTTGKKFTCTACGRPKSLKNKARHMREAHPGADDPMFPCENDCGQMFNSKRAAERHLEEEVCTRNPGRSPRQTARNRKYCAGDRGLPRRGSQGHISTDTDQSTPTSPSLESVGSFSDAPKLFSPTPMDVLAPHCYSQASQESPLPPPLINDTNAANGFDVLFHTLFGFDYLPDNGMDTSSTYDNDDSVFLSG